MENILVVGGAGYIGSYMCKYLAQNGYQPIVLDNLVCGHRRAVRWGPFFEGSMSDIAMLRHIHSKYQFSSLMHFAAYCYVGESVQKPADYYQNNVSETLFMLRTLIDFGVLNYIFSSTCAVYGDPVAVPIAENHPVNPINPYGRSKHMVEQILDDFAHAYGINYIGLRYFNAAGADPDGELGEDHDPETHLIPLILNTALGRQKEIKIFGDDYATEDGTCVRDYIHIHDLAHAHLLALEMLMKGRNKGIFNLGNETGYSVRAVIDVAKRITGLPIPIKMAERRPGDAAILVASSKKAFIELGWRPKYPTIEEIIETAWRWIQAHPDGYQS